ncbi:MAG TPA: hypothetical protein VJ875_24910 [Pyrinomonadaceae bacterium]|nr:hypothetical protein [Pyrinomonadaceae bacterium]
MKNSGTLNDDLDELFKLPLAEFTGARNALATRLKQSGRADDANLVKTLTKPSVSAWTVNQLYWNHRDAFYSLLAAGQRFHKAQTSGKVADMRRSLDARREVLSHLSDLATSLLQDAGHNPSQDTIRRITTTLEAVSARADGLTLGRLSQDVDPPGFESLASFVPGAATTQQKATPLRAVPPPEETRHAKIAAAKASLQAARKSLADARARAQSFDTAQKKAHAEVKQAAKELREAEERLKKASAASEEATKAVEDAERVFDKASKELESLFSKH